MDDGWGDDDFDVDDALGDDIALSNEEERTIKVPTKKLTPQINDESDVVDGWDDDDLDLDIPDDDAVDSSIERSRGTDRRRELSAIEQGIYCSLVDYIKSLPHIVSSLNAVFEAEYNTYDNALHLHEYYNTRPRLRDYTLETELPRMEYVVVGRDNTVLTEKQDVADFVANQPNTVLFRCANQSLLADVLTVLTGPDRFIRTQHFATAVATMCKFTLYSSQVHCDCRMKLSLPGISGQPIDVAHLDLSIDLQPEIPSVHYQLKEVVMLMGADEVAQLEDSAVFLAAMAMDDDSFFPEPASAPSNADAFRDSLLVQLSKTQQIVQASQTGLSSAWKQLDSVASVTKKLDFVKRVGGGMLPSLAMDKVLEEEAAGQSDSNTQQPPRPGEPSNRAPVSSDPHRPAPILGGFFMSGLTRLAKTVAMPDELPTLEEPGPRFPNFTREDDVKETRIQSHGHNVAQGTIDHPANIQRTNDISRSKFLQERRQDGLEDNNENDGWGDDDFSIGDEMFSEEDVPHKGHMPAPDFTRPSSDGRPPISLNSQVQSEANQEAPNPEVRKTPPPPPPIPEACKAPPPPPSPDFHYTIQDDIIPTRTRWINRRMLAS